MWTALFSIRIRPISGKVKKTGSWPKIPKASKIEFFVTIVNGLQPLTIAKKVSILDVAEFLDTLLKDVYLVHAPKYSHAFVVLNFKQS